MALRTQNVNEQQGSPLLSRLFNFFSSNNGESSDSSNVLPSQGQDEFRSASSSDNSSKSATARGLIASAIGLLGQMLGVNRNVNHSNITQISKWAAIHNLALRAVDLVQQAITAAAQGSPEQGNAMALKTSASAAVSEAASNIEFHKEGITGDMKAINDPGKLSSSTG